MANSKTNASKLIDKRVRELGDWRGKTLSKVREIIKEADPDVVEELKWVKPTNPGTPVWSHNGGICTGEIYKNVVKLTFFKGAALNDPSGLFNSSLDGKVRRAIDIKEDDKIDEDALKNLISEATALNLKASNILLEEQGVDTPLARSVMGMQYPQDSVRRDWPSRRSASAAGACPRPTAPADDARVRRNAGARRSISAYAARYRR